MTTLEASIERVVEAMEPTATPGAVPRLVTYVELLTRWNRAYNLSAVRDPERMVTHHIADSLSVRPWVPPGPLLDLGTGPGLPGLVLGLVEPERVVTLLDASAKKTRFLNQVIIELGLANVVVVQARAETWQTAEAFKAITSRALSSLADFWRCAEPYLARGGEVLAMKGRYPSNELAALPSEGLSFGVECLSVPGLDAERHLVRLSRAMP